MRLQTYFVRPHIIAIHAGSTCMLHEMRITSRRTSTDRHCISQKGMLKELHWLLIPMELSTCVKRIAKKKAAVAEDRSCTLSGQGLDIVHKMSLETSHLGSGCYMMPCSSHSTTIPIFQVFLSFENRWIQHMEADFCDTWDRLVELRYGDRCATLAKRGPGEAEARIEHELAHV